MTKEALTLESYIRQNCRGGKGKLTAMSRQAAGGKSYLRIEVKGLGKKPYAFRLEGDTIVTAAQEREEARKMRPKVSASEQKISKGVKDAIAG